MQAIRNKVIFKPFYETEIKGFILPDTLKKRNSSGVVVAVGNGLKDKPMEYKVGDIIYYIKNAGLEIEDKGEVFYVIDDFNILGYKRTENANN